MQFTLEGPVARRGVRADEVRAFLSTVADPAHGVYIGTPGPRWASLPGSDLDALIGKAEEFSDDRAVFFGLNPCPAGEKTLARNVLCRRWLFLDFDPVRRNVDGSEISEDANSTDDEHDAAHEVAGRAMDHLAERGWPMPLCVDSGNGWHLLYRVDLPNDDLSRALVSRALRHLAGLFDTDDVKLGVECFNANRLGKVCGTPTRKGPATADRPQRWARLAFRPEPVDVVPAELLLRLVEPAKPPAVTVPPAPPPSPPVAVNGRAPHVFTAGGQDYTHYVQAAVRAEAARVVMAGLQTRNTTLNTAAFKLGTLVGAGVLAEGEALAALLDAVERSGLFREEPDKCRDTIARALRAGAAEPRVLPAAATPAGASAPAATPAAGADGVIVLMRGEVVADNTAAFFASLAATNRPVGPKVYELLTIGEILDREFPEPNWAIPGLLSEGLNLMAGSPKTGKSMLALNLALTIAGGGMALDEIQTQAGDVLYLSLEDKLRRVKFRAVKMLAKLRRADVNRRLTVVTDWPRIDQGGLPLMLEWVKRVERPTLLIVDVLGRFRPPSRDRGNQYEQDSNNLYTVKQFLDDNGFNGLVLHHTRKAKSEAKDDDEFEEISGTQGIGGACDGLLLLRRARGKKDARLSITGRDGGERKLALEFDDDTLSWRSLGSAEEYVTGRVQKAILDYLKKRNGVYVLTSDLADQVKEPIDTVRKMCHELLNKGFLNHRGYTWSWPGAGETEMCTAD